MRVTAETKVETRRRILDVSQKLFGEHGFEATTTRDIARAAEIAAGTLFNYFPTKEAVACALFSEAARKGSQAFEARSIGDDGESPALEEDLFAHIASLLRKLRPFRKYLAAVLGAEFSPLAADRDGPGSEFRTVHLESVGQIMVRHGAGDSFTSVAAHLYWTLLLGALAFWSQDSSPKQEDTLALLDQSLAMFVGWLNSLRPDLASPPGLQSGFPHRTTG